MNLPDLIFTGPVSLACWIAALRSHVERRRITSVTFARDRRGTYRSMFFELEKRG